MAIRNQCLVGGAARGRECRSGTAELRPVLVRHVCSVYLPGGKVLVMATFTQRVKRGARAQFPPKLSLNN